MFQTRYYAAILLCAVPFTLGSHTMTQNQWITTVLSSPQSGSFTATDNRGTPVIVEYLRTEMLSEEFTHAMQQAWEVAKPAYTTVEMQFLKQFPEVVGKEGYYKPFEALFAQGLAHVNWAQVETTMQEVLKRHFVFTPSQFTGDMAKTLSQDRYFFVSVKDAKSHELLGFTTFLIRPSYEPGNVKVTTLAVKPEAQHRGLGRLVTAAIFKALPAITRIFLTTRVTNEGALKAYRSWGFTPTTQSPQDHMFNPEHWTFMEYQVDKTNTLQQTAQKLR